MIYNALGINFSTSYHHVSYFKNPQWNGIYTYWYGVYSTYTYLYMYLFGLSRTCYNRIHIDLSLNSYLYMKCTVADPGISKPGGRGRIFGPFMHTLRVSFVRIVNKIRKVNIDCRLQLKYMRVTQLKF